MIKKIVKVAQVFITCLLLLAGATCVLADPPTVGIAQAPSMRPSHDKERLPRRPDLDPKHSDDPKYVAKMWWKHLDYRSEEEAAIALDKQKKFSDSMGFKWYPPQPSDPNFVKDYFELPERDQLDNCVYTQGYSYPDICFDLNNNKIFDSSEDDQSVLDAIAKKQGRLGKYNKIPKEKPESTTSETMYLDD